MGRRPKYFTLEAKKAAKRLQAQNYRQSEKGKAAKSRANKLYHERKKANTTVDDAAHARLDVDIPDEVLRRGKKVLRASFAVEADEYAPTLGLWTSPYRFFPPDHYALDALPRPPWSSKTGLWESRAAVMGAYQHAQVLTAGPARYERWTEEPLDAVQRRVTGELQRRVAGWEELRESHWDMDDYPEDLHDTDLRELMLDWGAKLVCMLVEEWTVRARGLQEYRDSWEGGRLPWQLLVQQTKALYAKET